jgi:hypothetical protein
MNTKARQPDDRSARDDEDTAPDPHDGLHVAHELQRDGGPALPGEVRDRTRPPGPEAPEEP